MAEEDQQPIIIVKKKGGHGGHHGGAWKVAYADFVTAMMAFFLVMWLVSQDSIVKENVAGYFNDPGSWGKGKSGATLLDGGQSILNGGPSMLQNQGLVPSDRNMTETRAREVLKQAGERGLGALAGLPNFEEVSEHIEIEMTEEGLRIELIEATSANSDSSYFFTSGSANISKTGKTIITAISKELSKIDNDIVIEGHTDSHQFVYKAKYSNWELSADRANSARKLMVSNGVKEENIAEIRGYAANRPKVKDNPADARNRRISILVQTNLDIPPVESMEMHEVIDGKVVKDIH
jgi:chemotaxis protein MotB